MYRGHMYLWQDWGLVRGVRSGDGLVPPRTPTAPSRAAPRAWSATCSPTAWTSSAGSGCGFIVVLLSGFYVWYWPGVRRWATAFVIKRGRGPFTFNMSLHKVIGFVVWVPLLVVAFTGIAFAFPNMNTWYENATPARARLLPVDAARGRRVRADADGREPIDLDGALAAIERAVPGPRGAVADAAVDDETATYSAWVTRGFDPWTREGGAGNTLVVVDQYSGEVCTTGPPGRATSSTRRGTTGRSRCTPATSAARSPASCGRRWP